MYPTNWFVELYQLASTRISRSLGIVFSEPLNIESDGSPTAIHYNRCRPSQPIRFTELYPSTLFSIPFEQMTILIAVNYALSLGIPKTAHFLQLHYCFALWVTPHCTKRNVNRYRSFSSINHSRVYGSFARAAQTFTSLSYFFMSVESQCTDFIDTG